ncbi:hypothetical protein F53441_4438 [Fusarium austroafricanum]|uniref:Uncharacterized protein n=1 Tax=Fusarium austroafricanum TaxID=2364996 RepID=A0A8H4KLY3_9HYPO|nr:hypothetical protein F53441_4438 [Fusarium austroafricanum]
MSDNIDPEAAKAGVMSDLGRERQDDLPLSNRTRDGHRSYKPDGDNEAEKYPEGRKANLNSKWAGTINDDESKQMEGLKIGNPRPWAPHQPRKVAAAKKKAHAPALPSSSTHHDSAQPQRATSHVEFKPTTPAKWVLPKSTAAHISDLQAPSPAVTTNGTSSNDAPTSPAQEKGASSLVAFTKSDVAPENATSELVVGSGDCYIVPRRNRQSFVAKIFIILRMNEGILELHNNSKGRMVHNALDLHTVVHKGDARDVEVKFMKGTYHLRFGTVDETKTFKRCLSKVQKAARAYQQDTNKAQEDGEDAKISSQTTSPASLLDVPMTPPSIPQASLEAPGPILIEMGDDWGGVGVVQKLPIEQTTGNLMKLVHAILANIGNSQPRSEGAIAGVVDAICKAYRNERAFDQAKESKVKEYVMNMLRSMDELQSLVNSSESCVTKEVSEPTAENVVGQTNGSTSHSGRRVTQGLSASRFATRPVTFEGNFTGASSGF